MKRLNKELLSIFFISIISQGYLLFLTGTFWDDWLYYYHNKEIVWTEFMQNGVPQAAYWIFALWNLPYYGFRWVAFLLFALTGILIYLILNKMPFFDRKSAFWISLIYIVLPVNDTKGILCCNIYIFGWFLFLLSFYLLTVWVDMEKNMVKKWILRIVILFLFGCSFTINSLLMFYAIPFLYLYHKEYSNIRHVFKSAFHMRKYFDFIVLPFLYYIGKQKLFPVYGYYEAYNKLELPNVIKAAILWIPSTFIQCIRMWFALFDGVLGNGMVVMIIGLIVIIAIGILIYERVKDKCSFYSRFTQILPAFRNIIMGLVVLAMGLFPYLVIRGSISGVNLTGVGSRDALLLPAGFAMILYYIFKILFANNKMEKLCCVLIIFLGTITCNLHYVNYQKDWYWQNALVAKLKVNDEIREADNILFLSDDKTGIEGTRYYSLNGDASLAYGDQSRLFMNGYSDLYLLEDDSYRKMLAGPGGLGMLEDYDLSKKQLDGIAVFNCDITDKECLELKYLEITDYNKFSERIGQMGILSYYQRDSDEAEKLLEFGQ